MANRTLSTQELRQLAGNLENVLANNPYIRQTWLEAALCQLPGWLAMNSIHADVVILPGDDATCETVEEHQAEPAENTGSPIILLRYENIFKPPTGGKSNVSATPLQNLFDSIADQLTNSEISDYPAFICSFYQFVRKNYKHPEHDLIMDVYIGEVETNPTDPATSALLHPHIPEIHILTPVYSWMSMLTRLAATKFRNAAGKIKARACTRRASRYSQRLLPARKTGTRS